MQYLIASVELNVEVETSPRSVCVFLRTSRRPWRCIRALDLAFKYRILFQYIDYNCSEFRVDGMTDTICGFEYSIV